MKNRIWIVAALSLLSLLPLEMTPASAANYDIILRRGLIYDGNGGPPAIGDVAISKDTIVTTGDLSSRTGLKEIDVNGLSVADVVVFDPAKIQDHATFDNPHQYATGMVHVFVNGKQVLKNGEHTGAKPGRVVRGPGWKKLN